MNGLPELDMFRPNFSKKYGESLAETGFAVIVNHGVSPRKIQTAYEAARMLFCLPLAVKQACETPENGRQTGYTSMQVERAVGQTEGDLKEFWHVMSPNHPRFENVFPPECSIECRLAFLELFHDLERLSGRLL